MPKFRKKPVVIEAVQFTGKASMNEIAFLVAGTRTISLGRNNDTLSIETLEGVMQANLNDWIIKGVKGECYPCKPDIFEATYEPVDDDKYSTCLYQ